MPKEQPKKSPPLEVFKAIEEIFDIKIPKSQSQSLSGGHQKRDQKRLEEFYALPKEEQDRLIKDQIEGMYNYTVKVKVGKKQ